MIAALFPGQNSHAVGMGTQVAAAFAVAEQVMAAADAAVPGLRRLMAEGPLEELTLTAVQQPALVAASLAAYRAWREATGLTPAYAAGHSLGEYSAHVAAGSLDLDRALRLVHERGRLMQEAVPPGVGAMSAIMGDPQVVREVCEATEGVVEIANLNAPTQTVISGEQAAVERANAALRARGLKAIPLKVSAPFHCSLMWPAREGLTPQLRAAVYHDLAFPVVANVTAEPVRDAREVPGLLAQQITSSVRWVETLHRLADLGVKTFVEFGSGTVLAGLVKRTLPGAEVRSVHTPHDIAQFLEQA